MNMNVVRSAATITFVLAALALAGCGGSDDIIEKFLPPAEAPTIVSAPIPVTVTEGQAATFTVAANGTTPLTYQWARNGATIAGATSSIYSIAATTLADNGASFSASVSNSAGTVTSSPAILTVKPIATTSTALRPDDRTLITRS